MSRTKVIVEGPKASEMARIKNFLENTWKFGPLLPRDLRGFDVEFIERTPTAHVATLGIDVETTPIKEATKALNDLAEAAARARQAIKAL